MTGSFERCEALGRQGVLRVVDALAALPAAQVHDVQDDPSWQRAGCDLVVDRRGRRVAIEVKFERATSPNLVLETMADVRRRSPGWFITSHAALVLYGFQDSGEFWAIDLAGVRRALPSWEALRGAVAHTGDRGGWTTGVRLLPTDYLATARWVTRLGRFDHPEGRARLARVLSSVASVPSGASLDHPSGALPSRSCITRGRCPICGGGVV